MKNNYQCFVLDDTGAFELPNNIFDKFNDNYTSKDLSNYLNDQQKYLEDIVDLKLNMYNDKEFNKLNDFLFGPISLIISDRIKNLLQDFYIPTHKYKRVKVVRKEFIGFIKKEYSYNWLILDNKNLYELQNLIDFEKSIINVVDDEDNIDSTRTIRSLDDIKKITSQNKIIGNYTDKIHQNKTISKEERRIQIDEYCKINKTYGWVADKIVLNKNFDYNIDIFKIPTFSMFSLNGVTK